MTVGGCGGLNVSDSFSRLYRSVFGPDDPNDQTITVQELDVSFLNNGPDSPLKRQTHLNPALNDPQPMQQITPPPEEPLLSRVSKVKEREITSDDQSEDELSDDLSSESSSSSCKESSDPDWKSSKPIASSSRSTPTKALGKLSSPIVKPPPRAKRRLWTMEEDMLLLAGVLTYGIKWAEISREMFDGSRAPILIRQRYIKNLTPRLPQI